MSNAIVCIKFKDDLILYGCYHGTSDIIHKGLTENLDSWDEVGDKECMCGNDEEVEIYQDYGSSSYWTGRACRKCKCITSETCYYDEGDNIGIISSSSPQKGRPSWISFLK